MGYFFIVLITIFSTTERAESESSHPIWAKKVQHSDITDLSCKDIIHCRDVEFVVEIKI